MQHPKEIRIEDYNYPLPHDRIAAFPLNDRSASRLLVAGEPIISDVFGNIADYLLPYSVIIFNDSRVVEARLLFKKATGATIEVFCLEPDERYADVTTAFAEKREVYWKCLVGNAVSWPGGVLLKKSFGDNELFAELLEKRQDHFLLRLSWNNENLSFAEVLHLAGAIPLPPYIKRKVETLDADRYQTVYAHTAGSVAAPTAGLHFTKDILEQLKAKNIEINFVTLHVGAGTFKPVKSETVGGHSMHAEQIEINKNFLEWLQQNLQRNIIAVGTTSLRTLESLYWLGAKLIANPQLPALPEIEQWTPYGKQQAVSSADAIGALVNWMNKNRKEIITAKTSLIVVPGYSFKIVNTLITNFHQPKSTLLLLIAAFAGDKWKSAYAYALENDFRFLSYGDSCLFFRQ